MWISLERVCVNNSQETIKRVKVVDRDRGDLAEFGKKRNADYDFPPHYMWAEKIIL